MARVEPRPPSVEPHELEVVDGEPEDFFGNRNCAACNKPGRVGDAQHPLGAPELPRRSLATDWRSRQAGEHLQDDL